ncbi:14195_t:CDS:2 [Cetraspora pellucida]|uniref:14195_t:CDS:1 n=1 Tax=Cetraspora pellucida TaxID=1433469 RepID=A0A9N8ZSA2_9GLOM|nr:14195_t:CDS:2 [Cetraspora pellucida]
MLLLILVLAIHCWVIEGHLASTNVLIGSKLYTMGGIIDSQLDSNFFYYDFSIPFDASSPSYNSLDPIPVYTAWGSACVGGLTMSEIFLFGGIMNNKNDNSLSNNLIYCFDTINHTWTAPTISGIQPLRRREASSTFNPNNGWIYIFGGSTVKINNYNDTLFFNDFIILDSVALSWINIKSPSNATAPTRRASHTATLITNGYIVIIGGTEMTDDHALQDVDINQIWLYDTNSGMWMYQLGTQIQHAQCLLFINNIEMLSQITFIQFAEGDSVSARGGHTAVLAPNGNIIIYGGSNVDNIGSTPDLIILNVATSRFQWL